MSLTAWLALSSALFAIGLYGLLARRNALAVFLSIELMVNAANLNLAAFASHGLLPGGQALVVFSLALTVAEIVVGLAIALVLYRTRKSVLVDEARDLTNGPDPEPEMPRS
jgi:NADH-quinone oxidoreductase subunit K